MPPLTTMSAPEFASASKAISATPRVLPDTRASCQLGFGSNVLGLPPVAQKLPPLQTFQTTSELHVVVEAVSVVPATATTYGEEAGQLAPALASPWHSLAPESPVEIENV